ncbi:MAG: ATP-binding protein [Myxococcota bacterium]|nr:ATP-binding protein [Myxococcota bacterium]
MEASRRDGAQGPAEGSVPFLRRDGAFEQRLVVLMGARLTLALVSLGITLALDAAVGDASDGERIGLYGTVAAAFVATVVYGLVLPRIRRPRRFAAINIATDIVIVSALVLFSGGPDSLFAFLYLLVAAYGALLFEKRGALITASLGGAAYGAVLVLGARVGSGAESHHPTVLFAVWGVHAAGIALVAALSSFLAAELQRTGEALRQSTSDLRDLAHLHRRTVESLMSGLLTTDSEGRVTSFNPEAERITGRKAAWVLGRDLEEVLPGVREVAIHGRVPLGAHGRPRMLFPQPDGSQLHLGVAGYILRDVEGEPSGHVVIFQDVTDVVAMEAELRRSERLAAVGELSASIAHEIRNPLAAISGSIQILRRGAVDAGGLSGSGEAGRLMDIVLRETDRLNHLITDFLLYARPGPLQLDAVPLRECVDEMLEMLEASAPAGVRVEVDIATGLAVRADAAQLRQVLWNLALNGCQAMPEGGCLRIAAERVSEPQGGSVGGRKAQEEGKSAWVDVAVQDQGAGIPPDAMDHVFEPFFTTKQEGTGLGLATVHRIVQEHGGSIRVETGAERGTSFRIRLPGAEASS